MSLVTNRNNFFKKGVIGNVRKAQEDSHDMALDTPNGDVFVVCDGMGGHVGGAKASSLAVDSIISYLKKEKYSDPLVALNGALQFANMQILGFAAANPEYKGMGTTACILLMQGSEAWIAHVGDSRIYLYLGKEKKLHRITKDHSYVQTLVDAEKITDEQAEHHEHKNRILKALGVTQNLQPSFNPNNIPVRPKNGDIFLICSDGLSGMIPDKTIEKVLGNHASLEDRGELLIKLAMEGETVQPGGQDNCTLELIQVDSSPWPKSEFTSYNPKKSRKKSRKYRLAVITAAIVVALFVAFGIEVLWLNGIERQHTTDINNQQTEARKQYINMTIQDYQTQRNSLQKQLSEANSDKENARKIEEKNEIEQTRIQPLENRIAEYQKKIDSLNQIIKQ